MIIALKSCLHCDALMKPKRNPYEYNHRKYCSSSCSAKHRSPLPFFNCLQCGESTIRSKQMKKSGGSYNYSQKYCSKQCSSDSQRKGGSLDKNGYRYSTVGGKQVFEHRKVMENLIGRILTKDETVHHKNGTRSDNRPENLELWSSRHGKGQRVEDKILHAREILEIYNIPSNILTMSEAINGFMSLAA